MKVVAHRLLMIIKRKKESEWECPYCGHRNREDYVSVDYEDESSEVVCENCEETSQVTRIKIE